MVNLKMRLPSILTLAAEIQMMKDELSVTTPEPVYELRLSPAPSDDKMVFIPKKEKPYSENPRHSKDKR
jgi:hypothetical protein